MPALGFKAMVDPSLVCSLPACCGFLTFISGATPVDLLVASMVTEPFLINIQAQAHICFGGPQVRN